MPEVVRCRTGGLQKHLKAQGQFPNTLCCAEGSKYEIINRAVISSIYECIFKVRL